MNAKQKKLLDSVPVKKHDPDGVTVQMIIDRTGWSHAHSCHYVQEKIKRGEAMACWYKDGMRMVKAMKLK